MYVYVLANVLKLFQQNTFTYAYKSLLKNVRVKHTRISKAYTNNDDLVTLQEKIYYSTSLTVSHTRS
jgi:hypothetical protein